MALASVFSICVILFTFAACSVKNSDRHYISLRAPSYAQVMGEISRLGFTPPANRKTCFAVNVVGPDIPETRDTCGPMIGARSGFVGNDAELTVAVKKGTSRTVELYMFLAETSESCPSWDSGFSPQKYARTFKVGSTPGVEASGDSKDVAVDFVFTGLHDTVMANAPAASCPLGAPQIRSLTYSSGEVRDVNDNAFSPDSSAAYLVGVFRTLIDVFYGFSSSGEVINLNSQDSISTPPFLMGVTRKPDSVDIFGLDQAGNIVLLDATGAVTELTSTTCPFEECKVPVWMQSISAGFGAALYGLDHAGNIYRIRAGGVLVETGVAVSPAVTHVTFY